MVTLFQSSCHVSNWVEWGIKHSSYCIFSQTKLFPFSLSTFNIFKHLAVNHCFNNSNFESFNTSVFHFSTIPTFKITFYCFFLFLREGQLELFPIAIELSELNHLVREVFPGKRDKTHWLTFWFRKWLNLNLGIKTKGENWSKNIKIVVCCCLHMCRKWKKNDIVSYNL